LHRQGSQHTTHQHQHPSTHQQASLTHLSHNHSGYHHPSTTHHITRPRSRSRPPSAASHWYASTITPQVYGHGSSATLNASRTSLNGGPSSGANHHATLPPHGISASHHPGTESAHMPSESAHRSRLHTRVPSRTHGAPMTTHSVHKLKDPPPRPPVQIPAAHALHRAVHRPALPPGYDGQTQTRYIRMLLALDDISPLFNILASFFTWVLLAGFVLFPGTFASWKDEPAGSPQGVILTLINHLSLFVIAFICTGIGVCGMCWLWWRWQENYVWLTNRIFVPGFLNSVAGVISTLSSIYGSQGGTFGGTEKSTIIVTGVLTVVWGILVLVYEFWLLRNLRLEHDQEVGAEKAGEHGEGALE